MILTAYSQAFISNTFRIFILFVIYSLAVFVKADKVGENGDGILSRTSSEIGEKPAETFRQLPEEDAFIQRRLFNTSVAMTVPLFSFTLPQRASEGSSIDLANQVIFGLFSFLVTVLIFAVPVLFTGTRPSDLTGRSNDAAAEEDGILNRLLHKDKMLNMMGVDVNNKIGINPARCLEKTICEAHRNPKKYGLLATPFRIFFPPPSGPEAEARASSFRMAAKAGKEEGKPCGKQYKCFFDVLDLGNYMIDWWQYRNSFVHY